MTKLFFLVLFISITWQTSAQYQPKSESVFEMPALKIKRTFLITLERKDKMQIELTRIEDLARIRNIDSIVGLFLKDIEPLKDSLTESIFSRRIDYVVDSAPIKKIRFNTYEPRKSHFALSGGLASPLKMEQDTITLIGRFKGKIKAGLFGYYEDYVYYRISFFLNNLNNLTKYVNGEMNEKMKTLEQYVNSPWDNSEKSGMYLKKDPDITAPHFRGFTVPNRSFGFRFAVNVQNYKNYFVPSASYAFIIVKMNNEVKHKLGVQYENQFYFSNNGAGKLQTYVNDFVTLIYEREINPTGDVNSTMRFTPALSLGYLVKRREELYEKNSFKLGLGRYAPLLGNLRVEPTFYFDRFFKGVSPSLRVTQHF